ncbi:MAG TPA: hypothetical protein VM307_09500 [Egibacteraceae bacterium]|nr:hypothetical protein [Egibacteraceae bacterium]
MATRPMTPPLTWPDEVDEILAGDLVVVTGSPTPAGGVVLNSVTPLGIRDRAEGTVMFTTSLGFGRKLERIAADPRIAVAYHTRRHGFSDRPGLVVVQGVAEVYDNYSQEERDEIAETAKQHIGQFAEGRFWDWWLSVYYLDRVGVGVHARRILWWPDGDAAGRPRVIGEPLPAEPPPAQRLPRDPQTPRVPLRRVRRSARWRHALLGVLASDGMPLILPVRTRSDPEGLALVDPPALLPEGGRRAAFIAHDFRPKLVGLKTATHTGWLQAGERTVWTPHTRHAFYAPPNKTLLLLGNGGGARYGYRKALRQGRDQILHHRPAVRR